MHLDTSNIAHRKARILVVDDTPDNLFLMSALLEDQYEVVTAANGMLALESAQCDTPPELILLDIMMPDMDGYEVLRRLRATREPPASPSSSSPRCPASRTSSSAWTSAPWTTSPSRSARRWCWPACNRTWNAAATRAAPGSFGKTGPLPRTPGLQVAVRRFAQRGNPDPAQEAHGVLFRHQGLHGFDRQWQPEEITFLLNSYFSEMSRIAQNTAERWTSSLATPW
jgi:CheY-like chemotaxis protein